MRAANSRVFVFGRLGCDGGMSESSEWTTAVVHLLAGGLSGVVAKSSVAPLDRVKILYQTLSKAYPRQSARKTLSFIYATEGVKGLWRGNWSSVVRIYPYAAIQFASFERYKRYLRSLSPPGAPMFLGGHFVAGSLAGATAVSLTYPLDVVRARLAFQYAAKNTSATNAGISGTLATLWREGGPRKLYSGIGPTLYGIVPYAGTNFLVFEEQKAAWVRFHEGKTARDIPTLQRLAMGAVAGAIGQTLTYPLDVVRRRMQIVGMPETQFAGDDYARGTVRALRMIWRREGVTGLFRGISLNYVKVAPMVAISFTVFDTCKRVTREVFGVELRE